MGNSCITTKKTKQKYSLGDTVPQGTELIYLNDQTVLDLELQLSNIELRQPPEGLAGLRVVINQILDWKYEKVQNQSVLEWKQKRIISIRATEYQLRKMFIQFGVVNEKEEIIGKLSLNMFLIVTGPWRHDFMIQYTNGLSGRLGMDIKCSQTIDLQMIATKVQVNFINEHPGEMFHFTLKTEDLLGNSEMTHESYDVQTFLFNKKRSYQVDSEGESATLYKRKSMILEHQKGLQWSSSISQRAYQKELPGFNIRVKVDSISNYSFHFILWKKSEQDDETFESYGQTNIPMAKLFWTDVKGDNLNPEAGATRQIQIKETVQFMGKKCGVMVIRCKVTTPKFYQQVLVLTRTEYGITQSRRQILADKVVECQNLKKMRGIKQSMLNHMLKSGNFKNQHTSKAMEQYRQHKNDIYQDILRLERLFLQGMGCAPTFEYGCAQKLLKAQNEMIDIIEKLIPLTDVRQVCISQAAWRCLRVILLRGQFLLQNIGFNQKQIAMINSEPRCKIKKNLSERIYVCQNYQSILIKLLNLGLGRFGRKLLDEEFKFVAAISTVAYFKISEFRQQLLRSILNIHNNTERTYCYQNSYKKQNFFKLIDWESRFSKPLSKFGTNKAMLDEIKQTGKWKQIIGKRSTYFFVMIQDLANNLKSVLGWPDIIKCWSVIPGYNTLINSFLREMEVRQIDQYPDVMKDANISLLANECLLPIFMKILLQKTNTYQVNSTLKCLELISAYFANFLYKKQVLPSCFDSKLFYIAIKGILITNNCFTIGKLLQILYMYFNVFSNQFKKQISMLFLGKYFFELTLNWGRSVRMIFRCLIHYRILIWAKNKQISQINQRWDDLKIVFKQAEINNVKSKKEEMQLKNLSHLEKMRYKLSVKKVQKLEQICLDRRIHSQGFTRLKTEQSLCATTDIVASPMGGDQASYCFSKTLQKPKFSDDIDIKSVDERRSNALTPKKSLRNRRVSFFTDFQIGSVKPAQQPYLQTYKSEMVKFQEQLRIWKKTTKSQDDVPRIEMRVPIDKGDIRPDNMNI